MKTLTETKFKDNYSNKSQKKYIYEALKSIEEGKIYTHKEAMNILKTRHPNYFKK
jgi:hypothetical protein